MQKLTKHTVGVVALCAAILCSPLSLAAEQKESDKPKWDVLNVGCTQTQVTLTQAIYRY